MSKAEPIARINRVTADGQDRGDWTFVAGGPGLLCIAPDGTERALQSTSLLEALAEVPDAIRLAPRVLHSITYEDPDLQPADLAGVVGAANPAVLDTWWQDPEGWDDDLFFEHVDLDPYSPIPDAVVGNLPLTINGTRCLPTQVEDDILRLVPFYMDQWLPPAFVTPLGQVFASNDWGSCHVEVGVLPRGYLCEFGDCIPDASLDFRPLGGDSQSYLQGQALNTMNGFLASFAFQESPRLELVDGGRLDLKWPNGYDPARLGESASARIL